MPGIRMYTKEQMAALSLIPHHDALAFTHMERMLRQGHSLILSDGLSFQFVQGDMRFPAWLWTADGITDEELEDVLLAVSTLREQGRLHSLVAKNKAARLIELAFGPDIGKKQRLTVYRLDALCPFCAEGERINGCDVPPETAGEMIASLAEADGINVSPAMRREMGYAFITSKYAYAWKTQSGEIASIAKISEYFSSMRDEIFPMVRHDLDGKNNRSAPLTEAPLNADELYHKVEFCVNSQTDSLRAEQDDDTLKT